MKYKTFTWLIFMLSFIGVTTLYSQTVEPDYCGGDLYTTTSSNLQQINPALSYQETIYPSSNDEKVRIIFDSRIRFISGLEYIRIYNGEDTSELLGTILELDILYGGVVLEYISTHNSGALTITWNSDDEVGPRFTAEVSCISTESEIEFLINNISEVVTGYDRGNQHNGSFETIDGGNTLQLHDNTWAKTDFDYTITANTVMNFDIKITNEGEIHGILFDNNDTHNGEDSSKLFQISGNQIYGIQDFNSYRGNDWISYAIPVGEFFTGEFNNIVFVADKDANPTTQESFFRNINFSEQNVFPINNISEVVTGYDIGNQHNGSFETIDSGNTLQLHDNTWAKTDFDYTITANTVVNFDIKITNEGEIHGILFDNNDTHNGDDSSKLFQISGNQIYGIQNFNSYTGNDWISYAIPVGEFFTGEFNNIVFVADKDVNPTTQESFFRNINLFENTSQDLDSKQVSDLSGINQIETSFVGPNPANEYVDIQSSFNQIVSEAHVYSMNGSLIKKVTNHDSDVLHVDVSDIPDGMYLVNYVIGIESHVTRLVIKH